MLIILIGKGNVKVANGSVYGVGIYLARDASFSMGYCKGGNQMFACAVLVGKQNQVTTPTGDIIVAFKNEVVLPCFLITFKTGGLGYGNHTIQYGYGNLVKQ